MKRIAILMVMALMSFAAVAAPIRYFTKSQATRAVSYLNAQNELMIYCGYDYEIETYVLLNEVWAERVNSSYYELWVFGYDAYTGEEIYMPLDLQCVWLYSAGRMYSAAQYLRFYTTVHMPNVTWYVPAYNPYTRIVHRPGYTRTYHYDVHCHGWMPPAPPMGGYGPGMRPPMHPYYMRQPHTPAPHPSGAWTPGVDHPHVTTPDTRGRTDAPRTDTPTSPSRPSAQPSGPSRSGTSTTTPTRSSGTSTDAPTRSSGTSTSTPTRSSGTSTSTPTRSSGTSTSTPTRSSGTSTTTPTRSSGTSTTTPTRSSGTSTTTPTKSTPTRNSSSATTTPSRGNATSTTSTTRSGSSATATSTRSTSSASGRSSSTTTSTREKGTSRSGAR